MRRQEDFLEQILGICRIPQHPAGDAEQFARVRLVELLEGRQVSVPAPFDERHLLCPHGVSGSRRGMLCHLRRSHDRSTLLKGTLDLTEFVPFRFRPPFASRPALSRLRAKTCSVGGEISDGGRGNLQSFGTKERTLQLEISTKAAEFARCRDNPVTWNIGPPAVPHDVPNRPRGTWSSGGFSNVAVRRHAADRNASNNRKDGVFEIQNRTLIPTPPCSPPAFIVMRRPSTASRSMSARV